MYVDTREKLPVITVARRHGFIPMGLECGDYSTDKAIVERKKLSDFIQSCQAHYGKPPRIYDQLDRILAECERTQRIPILFITGRLSNRNCPKCGLLFEGAEAEFNKRMQEQSKTHPHLAGLTLNKNMIFGSFASIWVRYQVSIIWTEQPITEWMPALASMLEKIDEGKLLMPHRRKLKEFANDKNTAVIARALELQPKKAAILAKEFGGLYQVLHIAKTSPSRIHDMPEIGSRTLSKIKDMAGIV